jgi:hypothetical protein
MLGLKGIVLTYGKYGILAPCLNMNRNKWYTKCTNYPLMNLFSSFNFQLMTQPYLHLMLFHINMVLVFGGHYLSFTHLIGFQVTFGIDYNPIKS